MRGLLAAVLLILIVPSSMGDVGPSTYSSSYADCDDDGLGETCVSGSESATGVASDEEGAAFGAYVIQGQDHSQGYYSEERQNDWNSTTRTTGVRVVAAGEEITAAAVTTRYTSSMTRDGRESTTDRDEVRLQSSETGPTPTAVIGTRETGDYRGCHVGIVDVESSTNEEVIIPCGDDPEIPMTTHQRPGGAILILP